MGAAAGNGTEAARLAGYTGSPKVLGVQATRLLKRASVQSEIAERMRIRTEHADIDAVRVLKELVRIGLSDPRELFTEHGELKPITAWSDDMARAVASVEVIKGRHEDLHKIKLWDKNSALDKIARHLGMYVDKVEHSGTISLAQLLGGSK